MPKHNAKHRLGVLGDGILVEVFSNEEEKYWSMVYYVWIEEPRYACGGFWCTVDEEVYDNEAGALEAAHETFASLTLQEVA